MNMLDNNRILEHAVDAAKAAIAVAEAALASAVAASDALYSTWWAAHGSQTGLSPAQLAALADAHRNARAAAARSARATQDARDAVVRAQRAGSEEVFDAIADAVNASRRATKHAARAHREFMDQPTAKADREEVQDDDA